MGPEKLFLIIFWQREKEKRERERMKNRSDILRTFFFISHGTVQCIHRGVPLGPSFCTAFSFFLTPVSSSDVMARKIVTRGTKSEV